MKTVWLLFAAFVLLTAQTALAGGGVIPIVPGVKIYEPAQRAVIAFDGKEEILLLSSDLKASEATKVLEVIPFPSKPTVTRGDVEIYNRAVRLINERLATPKVGDRRPAKRVAEEATFHKKIGATDITVMRVDDAKTFVARAQELLTAAGADDPTVTLAMRRVVEEYLRDGFKWFAFNIIELDDKIVTKEAIQYRFATKKLYYPLRLDRSKTGLTAVHLVLVSPRLVALPNLDPAKMKLMHDPVDIFESELAELDKEIHKLLPGEANKIRLWEIKARLSSFRRDVFTPWH
jgi:hypothetical protein